MMRNRKIWKVLTAAAVAAAAVIQPFTALGATAPDWTSVQHLADALTTAKILTAADDYDGNGIIDVIDLTLMKRDLLTQGGEDLSGEIKTQNITADAGKRIGRIMDKNDVTWLVQSGSAVECTITATEATVTIAGDGCVYSDEKYRPRYGVYVDGELVADVVMGEAEQTVPLFSGKEHRTATVKVMHLSEANNGAVGIKHFTVSSAAATPIKPTAKKDLSIEFIGDSITCAYGVEADSQYVSFSTGTENFSKSYAYLTAELLNADYSAVSYSGYGVISGYSNDGTINTDSLVPDCYTLVGKPADYAEAWDFDANPSDVVVINLGTNDSSYLAKDFDARKDAFTAGYVDFLGMVRANNPHAYIICTVGTMGCAEVYPLIEEAVAAFGDAKVSSYLCATHDIQNDGIGADWHPSAVTQQKSAYVLADKIADAIGLPWDEVGLDAAADRTYDVIYDTAQGIYVSDYVNTYDNSLTVSMTTAGDAPEDVQAIIGNLSLREGVYALKLTCKNSVDMSVPYCLCSTADPATIYMEGTLEMTANTPLTLETELTMTTQDACEFQLLLGGTAGAQFAITGMSMYKLS